MLLCQGTDDSITKARKILSSMSRRMLQNKIIMIGVIVFLLLGIILVSVGNTKQGVGLLS